MLPNNTVIKSVMNSMLTGRDVVAMLPEETDSHGRVIDVRHRVDDPAKTYAFVTPVPVQDRGELIIPGRVEIMVTTEAI